MKVTMNEILRLAEQKAYEEWMKATAEWKAAYESGDTRKAADLGDIAVDAHEKLNAIREMMKAE